MRTLIPVAALTLAAIGLCLPVQAEQTRIINGKRAQISQYPWLASLFVASESDPESGGGCGGSLISSRWVLTAAHCFLNSAGDAVSEGAASRTTVTLSTTNIGASASGAIVVDANQVIVHPNYNPNQATSSNSNDYDIALVELKTPVSITPVRLYTGGIPTGLPTIVAGWGATQGDGSNSSDDLLATQLLISTTSACQAAHEGLITSNMLCAGGYTSTDTSDTCQGDSGGPLFIRLKQQGALQIGITSFGGSDSAGCGTPGSPGVYANVAELYPFISSHVPDASTLSSVADASLQYNAYDAATDSVIVPKVYGGDVNYSVTLKHNGNYQFSLAAATENSSDNMDAVPAYFDNNSNVLILPLVKVGSDTFNVRLKHLGNFQCSLESAEAP